MIVCFAVVGKGFRPLFLRPYTEPGREDVLRFHSIVHSSLDVFEERLKGAKNGTAADMFLGFLCPVEQYRVYGYQTTTQIRLVAVLEDDTSIKEQELQNLFSTVHDFYVNHLRNPFTDAVSSLPLVSERFRLAVDRQVNSFNADL